MTQSLDSYRMPQEYNSQPTPEVQPEIAANSVEFSPHELTLLIGHALDRVRKEVRKEDYDLTA